MMTRASIIRPGAKRHTGAMVAAHDYASKNNSYQRHDFDVGQDDAPNIARHIEITI